MVAKCRSKTTPKSSGSVAARARSSASLRASIEESFPKPGEGFTGLAARAIRRRGYPVCPETRHGGLLGKDLRMGSSSKRQTTMAKMARERRLQEKRERKAE